MKKLMTLMFVVLFCLNCTSPAQEKYNYADTYNYSQFKNKIVRHIEYCDNCASSGDLLKIYFTDNTVLNIYAYKYTMEIR